MGTRALFKIYDERNKEICTIYVQHDGYPDGWGLDVANFLSSKEMVNGIPPEKYGKVFNGMEDLTAQLITWMKLRISRMHKELLIQLKEPVPKEEILAGSVYVYPPGTKNVWEEYVYHIYPKGDKIMIKAEDVFENNVIFEGTVQEYVKFIEQQTSN